MSTHGRAQASQIFCVRRCCWKEQAVFVVSEPDWKSQDTALARCLNKRAAAPCVQLSPAAVIRASHRQQRNNPEISRMSETKLEATPNMLLQGSTTGLIIPSPATDNAQRDDNIECSANRPPTVLPKEKQSASVGENSISMTTATSNRKLQPGNNSTATAATSPAFEQHRKLLTDIVQSTPIAGLSADAQRSMDCCAFTIIGIINRGRRGGVERCTEEVAAGTVG